MSTSLTAALTDFDGLPIAGTMLDIDGTILVVNQAATRLMVRPAAQILGKKVWQFAPGLDLLWNEIIGKLHQDGEASGDITVATPAGPRDIHYTGALRRFETRSLILVFAIPRDVIRPDEAEEVAKQRLEALGLVAGGIAHDFNNQLVSVLAEASAAREDGSLSESAQQSLRRIEAAANRMAQLTRQLLAYAGRGRFVSELVDPDQLISEAHEQLVRSVRADAELDIELAGDSVVVEADRSLLAQVLLNIVANASEALRADGRIQITTRSDDTWWTLEVKDSGIGMEPSTIERIFDPFFTTKPAHHGLGLSAVSGIVRRLGGELHVDSRPGAGSTFQVRLRTVPNVSAEPRQKVTPAAGFPTAVLAGARVLVADDEPSVRVTIRRLLERRGASVVTASDGREAEAALRDGAYSFVLLDVMMPKLTGYQLLPLARVAQPDAKVMLMSGYTEAARGAGGDEEPDAFLEKPFTANELDSAVIRLLD